MLTFGELFAGISGFGLGFEQVGMKCLWQVELDRDCNKVLEARYPNVERIRNVKDAGKHNLRPVDVIAFGWPCQDLSVAGLRAGISGKRSGLFHEAARVIQELRPKWIVAENVPGLFSSYTPVDAPPSDVAIGTEWEVEEDSDFERVLATLDELGYCVSWRVCDAQFWNVAQRRERVFIVGSLGNLGSCEVFPFAESLPGDFETRREAGPGVTPILEAGARTNGDGHRDGDGIGVEGDPMFTLQSGKQHAIAPAVAPALTSRDRKSTREDIADPAFVIQGTYQNTGHGWWNESPTAQSIRTPEGGGSLEANVVTHALRSEGADASEDGTGRGTPIIPIDMRQASRGEKMTNNRPAGSSGGAPGTGIGNAGDPCPTIADSHVPAVFGVANCFNGYTGGADDNDAQANHLIAFSSKDHGADAGEIAPTLRSQNFKDSHMNGGGQVAIAFTKRGDGVVGHDIAPSYDTGGGGGMGNGMAVAIETLQPQGYNVTNASPQETHAREVLRALRQEVGETAFAEWGLGILDSFQPPKVLQSDLHGEGVCRSEENGSRVDDGASSRKTDLPAGAVREVREAGRKRCPPQERRLAGQLAGELRADLSQLPHEGPPPAWFLRGLWQASEGLGALQQALDTLSQVWRSKDGQAGRDGELNQSQVKENRGVRTYGVRRLTPL